MSEEQLIKTPCVFGENGNFLLERELGRGGMGGVYMGRDKMLDRPVAVKVMLKEYGADPEFVEKFKKEAQAAARLIHPNIAQVYSYGIADGMPYIAMELVAGGSLDQVMRNSGANTDVPRVMKICEQVAQALRCAADQGLVHGDVKPENILLDANGNAKLVDFGLAAMQKDTDEIWGTPYYIAPEKVKKEPVDYRADMYSLGGTIYHALTGVAPFEGDDAAAVVRKRFETMPAKPSEVRAGLSPQIDFLVMKMLEFDPANRYPSFESLLADYKKVLTTGLSSTQTLDSEGAQQGGSKKLVIKTRRVLKVSRPSDAEGDEEGGDEDEAEQPRGGRRVKGFKTSPRQRQYGGGDDEYADEDEGGVGGKVALVVGGVIGAIVLVGLALWGLTAANDSSNLSAGKAQIEENISKAKQSLSDSHRHVLDFRDKIDAMAEDVMKDCKAVDKEARKVLREGGYPESIIAMIDTQKPGELVKAEKALAPEGGAAAPAEPVKKAAPPPDPKKQKAMIDAEVAAGKRFRAPVGEETDPASPEHEAYMKEKAAWEAAHKGGGGEAAAAQGAAPAAQPAASAPDRSKEDAPPLVRTMSELWGKAYAAQAAALRTRKQLVDLAKDIESAMAIGEHNQAEMERIAAATTDVNSKFDAIKRSADIETLTKAKGTVKERGDKAIKKMREKIRVDKLVKDREAEKRRKAEEEAERQRKLAEEKARLVESETALAKQRYSEITGGAAIRQLDWVTAKSQLQMLLADFKSAEGVVQVKNEMKKLDVMENAHKVLVRNCKGYVFQKAPLHGKTVQSATDKDLVVVDQGGKGMPKTISWQKFYSEYRANLCELFNKFIRNGRTNGRPKLKGGEWGEAMIGTALMMNFLCSDDASAAEYAGKMLTDALKEGIKFGTGLLDFAKDAFPDFNFAEIEGSAVRDQL